MKNYFFILILFLNFTLICSDLLATDKAFVSSLLGLRLREKADIKSSVVELIPFGKEVNVLERTEKEEFVTGRYGYWSYVDSGNKKGWIFDGFLSEFDPKPLRKIVADHYRSYYKKRYDESTDKVECDKSLFNYGDDQVIIESIVDKYILLTVPSEDITGCDVLPRDAIWFYDNKDKLFKEVLHNVTCSKGKLLYLNNDKYPDLVQTCGCCGDVSVYVKLGKESGLEKEYNEGTDISFECNEYYENDKDITENTKYGKCGETRIHCGNYSQKEYREYQFNCKKNDFDIIKRRKIKD